jgi:hypothetical protein
LSSTRVDLGGRLVGVHTALLRVRGDNTSRIAEYVAICARFERDHLVGGCLPSCG